VLAAKSGETRYLNLGEAGGRDRSYRAKAPVHQQDLPEPTPHNPCPHPNPKPYPLPSNLITTRGLVFGLVSNLDTGQRLFGQRDTGEEETQQDLKGT